MMPDSELSELCSKFKPSIYVYMVTLQEAVHLSYLSHQKAEWSAGPILPIQPWIIVKMPLEFL